MDLTEMSIEGTIIKSNGKEAKVIVRELTENRERVYFYLFGLAIGKNLSFDELLIEREKMFELIDAKNKAERYKLFGHQYKDGTNLARVVREGITGTGAFVTSELVRISVGPSEIDNKYEPSTEIITEEVIQNKIVQQSDHI